MASGVDRKPAVGAGGASGREDGLRLPGEGHHLFRRGPEPGGGQAGGIIVFGRRRLPRDDDEEAPVLVVPETELADSPFGVAWVRRRKLHALGRRPEPLRLQKLANANDQTLDVELLTIEDDGLVLSAGA